MENTLSYKIEGFEGPLDLLLQLIARNKLNIYDIPLTVLIDQYLEQQHIASGAINVVARMNDLEAVKRSIINGLGISILSAKSVQDLNASRQVLIFPLAHPAPTRKLYIVYRKEHALLPHVRRFIQFVRSYYQPQ